jgi:anaerobic ribonucleoside-triphosphate reductase
VTEKAIDQEIERIEKEMTSAGRNTALSMTRISGYARPVQNWNAGKAEEYRERKCYEVKKPPIGEPSTGVPVGLQ